MRFDYDLVILGGTIAARQAALTAAQWNARVALVEPLPELAEANALGIHQALLHRTSYRTRRGRSPYPALTASTGETATSTVNWSEIFFWARGVVENMAESRSPTRLAAYGVDVIVGTGEFCRRPRLGFAVNGRVLRSRRYLLAAAVPTTLPPIEGLADASPFTLDDLWRSLPSLPANAHLIVIGATPTGIELTQILIRLGFQVTLVSNRDRLLPQDDADAVRLVQAQLETEGVQVLTRAEVTQVRRLGDQTWVQAGTRALEADAVVVMAGQPIVAPLNLEAIGVATTASGIQVNSKLQTTNPRVYACGDMLGNSAPIHVAAYEAEIAVKNALFFPRWRVNPQHIPWIVATDPAIARIGLTETQAKQQYGDRITTLYQPFKQVAKAQLRDDITGFCKLIVRPNGQIVGAHIVGAEADEVIGAIAPLIYHRHPLQSLTTVPTLYPSGAEILQQCAMEWRQQQGDRLRDWREAWFDWRRS